MRKGIALSLILVLSSQVFSQLNRFSEWTWLKGGPGQSVTSYGIQGVAQNSNTPGIRSESVYWKDASGKFWLFGGHGYPKDETSPYSIFDDIWRYDPATNQWTWIRGRNQGNNQTSRPVYGTKGVAAPDNTPGSRRLALSWLGKDGNLWVFGGTNGPTPIDDMWKYNMATNEWTWIRGLVDWPEQLYYTALGVSSPRNNPGARMASSTWVDSAGDLWLFGGFYTNMDLYNDLWKFSVSTGEWTCIQANTNDYQTKPGGRYNAFEWTDKEGNFWVFGGYGTTSETGSLNDLWMYNIKENKWTLKNGDLSIEADPVYGSPDIPSKNNTPGNRNSGSSWTDAQGNLWLFGGYRDKNVVGKNGLMNDLWRYDPVANTWTWVKGGQTPPLPAVYGTRGQPAPSNTPGGRNHPASWTDSKGSLYLFGGRESYLFVNDLWKLPAKELTCPTVKLSPSTACAGDTLAVTFSGAAKSINWQRMGVTVASSQRGYASSGTTVAGGKGLGGNPNQLFGASGLYVDNHGNVYVADRGGNRVQKWAPGASSGITVAGGNGQGSAANQLFYPEGIFVDSVGNVYVADRENCRVQKWAPGATSGVTVAGGNGYGSGANQLALPIGIHLDEKGNLYIADILNNRIQKWAPGASSGTTVAGGNGEGRAANQTYYPADVFVDAGGNIYVAEPSNARVQKWAPGATSGVPVAQAAGSSDGLDVNGIYVDQSGNVYVAEWWNHRVSKWAPGAKSGVIIAGGNGEGNAANQTWTPMDVFVDSDGHLYVSEDASNRVQRFNALPPPLTYTPTLPGTYRAEVISEEGCVVVSNPVTIKGPLVITEQPSMASPVCLNSPAPALTVAVDDSTVVYQWYEIVGDNDSTGRAIVGAVSNTFTPSTTMEGIRRYYAEVTNICGFKARSATVPVTVTGPTTWFLDADGDGYYTDVVVQCELPGPGYKKTNLKGGNDYNDNDNTIYPGAPELCDGKDNNGNGLVDEGCNRITSLMLVNATTSQDIVTLHDGAVIDLATISGKGISIRANTDPVKVGSVVMLLSGQQSHSQTENILPYALFGDDMKGAYYSWQPTPGAYTLKVTAYSGSGGSGPSGSTLSISFTVKDESANQLPVADAGAAQTTTLPYNYVRLNGSGTDPDGSITAYNWTQISGPSMAAFSSKHVAKPTVGWMVAGTYVFGLQVTDNRGGVSPVSTVTIVVKPALPALSGLTLVNAATGKDIGPLADGAVIDLALTPSVNVRADPGATRVSSVRFGLNSNGAYRVENIAPFALAADNMAGGYYPWEVTPGIYTITATPFSETNAGGVGGTPIRITVTVKNSQPALSGFMLVRGGTNEDIGPLINGAVVDLSIVPNISLRAIPTTGATVGSVRFGLNGLAANQMENSAPYALRGHSNGVFTNWDVTPGDYTITATPYAEPNGGGIVGKSVSITITIKKPAMALTVISPNNKAGSESVGDPGKASWHLKSYPNPVVSSAFVEFRLPVSAQASVTLLDIAGRTYQTMFSGKAEGGVLYKKELRMQGLARGVYFVRLLTGDGKLMTQQIIYQ